MPATYKKIPAALYKVPSQRYIVVNKASGGFLNAFDNLDDAAAKAKRCLETGLEVQIIDNQEKRIVQVEVDKYGRIFLF